MIGKGPSINDVTPRGEGGGYPQKVTWGDRGRDPVFSRGDVTPKLKICPLKENKVIHYY